MIDLNCSHCGRFLGRAKSIVGELICSNSSCKAGNQFKILTADEAALISFKFADAPRPPKSKQAAPSDSA